MNKEFYIYIMTNKVHTVLHTGLTDNLIRKATDHKGQRIKSFKQRDKVTKLVYFELFEDAYSASLREKQIKAESRRKKLALINGLNPKWEDLYKLLICVTR